MKCSFLVRYIGLSGLLFLQLRPIHSFAQSTIRYGIKGGMNSNALIGYAGNMAYDAQWKRQFGFHAGVFAKFRLASILAVQPELLYITKGGIANYTSPRSATYLGKGTYHLSYLELPVVVTFRLAKRVELQAGPYGSYLLSASSSTIGNFVGTQLLIRESFNKYDYGVTGGINLLIGKTSVGIRYSQGLRQVGIAGVIFSDNLVGDSKNAVGQVTLGYHFN